MNTIDVPWLPHRKFQDGGGYMTSPADRAVLVRLITMSLASRVLELGVSEGETARFLLDRCLCIKSYIGVDVPPDFVTTLNLQQTEVPAVAGRLIRTHPKARIIVKPTQHVSADEIGECDFVFIDADHSADGVARDTKLARECVKHGIIAWHDYRNPGEPITEVNNVLDKWLEHDITHIKGTWIAFERILK